MASGVEHSTVGAMSRYHLLVTFSLFILACGSVSSNPDATVQNDTGSGSGGPTCNATSCVNGCCDTAGMCRAAPACGTAGAACVAGCPLTVAESDKLVLWLVGDDFDPNAASKVWPDRSGRGANASCAPPLTCPTAGTINNKRDLVFAGGTNGFALTDPSMLFKSQSWTFFIVARPNATAPAYSAIFGFYVANQYVKFQRDNLSANIAFQVIPGSSTNYVLTGAAGYGWAGNWERLFGSVDATGAGKVGIFNSTANINAVTPGTIGAPANVDYSASYVGTSPNSPGTTGYIGEIAEIVVFSQQLSDTTQQSIHDYLRARYGF